MSLNVHLFLIPSIILLSHCKETGGNIYNFDLTKQHLEQSMNITGRAMQGFIIHEEGIDGNVDSQSVFWLSFW